MVKWREVRTGRRKRRKRRKSLLKTGSERKFHITF
jgi:hypothetical protein